MATCQPSGGMLRCLPMLMMSEAMASSCSLSRAASNLPLSTSPAWIGPSAALQPESAALSVFSLLPSTTEDTIPVVTTTTNTATTARHPTTAATRISVALRVEGHAPALLRLDHQHLDGPGVGRHVDLDRARRGA